MSNSFSPNDIHTMSRNYAMRINKMINSFNSFSKEKYRRPVWRICIWTLGLKGPEAPSTKETAFG